MQTNSNSSKRPWRKVLYDIQSYPDNYVDPQKFLEELDLTIQSKILTFSELLIGATVIAQQLTVLALFLTLYKYIMVKYLTFAGIVSLDISILMVGYLTKLLLTDQTDGHKHNIYKTILSSIVSCLCLRIATPILQTLTSSFSDDTIHALVIFFSVVHLIFHDYLFINNSENESEVFEGTLSLNAAMLTSLLLASRLDQIEMVFGFVVLAIISFSFFPQIARLLKKRSNILHCYALLCKWLLASCLLFALDKALFAIYELLMFVLLAIAPYWMMKMQSYKKSLRGPWDIASL